MVIHVEEDQKIEVQVVRKEDVNTYEYINMYSKQDEGTGKVLLESGFCLSQNFERGNKLVIYVQ